MKINQVKDKYGFTRIVLSKTGSLVIYKINGRTYSDSVEKFWDDCTVNA